jgi:hypothetical protein
MQYMLLIYDDADAGEREGLMQEYFAYTDELEASGKLVSSAPLHPSATAQSVRVREGEISLSDGPYAETKEQLGGYYVLECGSIEEALGWAAKVPAAATGSVEVRQVMDYEAAGFPNPAAEAARSA